MQDINLEIAVGASRTATSWVNTNFRWSDLINRCITRYNTHESFAAFMAGTPEFKSNIKDVGGFVSGYAQGGSRGIENILYKQVITLDADYTSKDPGFLERIKSMPFTLLYYTTHSHSAENPRYRILIPLDRAASAAEYEPAARKVAEALGIENMDRTSYQLNRLMFWPSSSHDAEFLSGYVQGGYVSLDQVLASYRDYRDSSTWPRAEGEIIAIRNEASKLGNPEDKPGIIGAFCQVFDAEGCVEELLSDYYVRSDSMPDRFSYVHSSTSNGLTFHQDGAYAYSFHASDPANTGHPLNAFDLMRIHKFGEKEDRMDQPMGKRKSFIEAEAFAMTIPEVKALMINKHLSANVEFKDLTPFGVEVNKQSTEPDETGRKWTANFITDKQGKPLSNPHNLNLVFKNDPIIKDCFAFDQFANRLVLLKSPGWRKDKNDRGFKDTDDAYLRSYFDTAYGITGKEKIIDALSIAADMAGFHPVRSYLESLKWDGVPRIERLFNAFLGAEDSEYIRQISRKWFTAAVARIFVPGVKFDNMIIFVGKEGIGKSTLVGKLGGEWFSDTSIDLRNKKESMEDLQGVWIMEWAELTSFRTASVEAVKSFVSKRSDRFRPAYGRRVEEYARQCIFMGSTNVMEFLNDPDGNRRFWPVLTQVVPICADVHTQLTEEVRAQVWAEAVNMFKAGEPLHLPASIVDIAKEIQQAHTESDLNIPVIDDYLEWEVPAMWYKMNKAERETWILNRVPGYREPGYFKRDKICVTEIWVEALKRDMRDIPHQKARFIKTRLEKLGWTKCNQTTFGPYPEQRGYVRNNLQKI